MNVYSVEIHHDRAVIFSAVIEATSAAEAAESALDKYDAPKPSHGVRSKSEAEAAVHVHSPLSGSVLVFPALIS